MKNRIQKVASGINFLLTTAIILTSMLVWAAMTATAQTTSAVDAASATTSANLNGPATEGQDLVAQMEKEMQSPPSPFVLADIPAEYPLHADLEALSLELQAKALATIQQYVPYRFMIDITQDWRADQEGNPYKILPGDCGMAPMGVSDTANEEMEAKSALLKMEDLPAELQKAVAALSEDQQKITLANLNEYRTYLSKVRVLADGSIQKMTAEEVEQAHAEQLAMGLVPKETEPALLTMEDLPAELQKAVAALPEEQQKITLANLNEYRTYLDKVRVLADGSIEKMTAEEVEQAHAEQVAMGFIPKEAEPALLTMAALPADLQKAVAALPEEQQKITLANLNEYRTYLDKIRVLADGSIEKMSAEEVEKAHAEQKKLADIQKQAEPADLPPISKVEDLPADSHLRAEMAVLTAEQQQKTLACLNENRSDLAAIHVREDGSLIYRFGDPTGGMVDLHKKFPSFDDNWEQRANQGVMADCDNPDYDSISQNKNEIFTEISPTDITVMKNLLGVAAKELDRRLLKNQYGQPGEPLRMIMENMQVTMVMLFLELEQNPLDYEYIPKLFWVTPANFAGAATHLEKSRPVIFLNAQLDQYDWSFAYKTCVLFHEFFHVTTEYDLGIATHAGCYFADALLYDLLVKPNPMSNIEQDETQAERRIASWINKNNLYEAWVTSTASLTMQAPLGQPKPDLSTAEEFLRNVVYLNKQRTIKEALRVLTTPPKLPKFRACRSHGVAVVSPIPANPDIADLDQPGNAIAQPPQTLPRVACSATHVPEGGSVLFTVFAPYTPDYTWLDYRIFGFEIDKDDFVGGAAVLKERVQIVAGVGKVVVAIAPDERTEGDEPFAFEIPQLNQSVLCLINDTSLSAYTVDPVTTDPLNPTVNEGDVATFHITAIKPPSIDARELEYDLSGDIEAADIVGPMKSTVTLDANGEADIKVTTVADGKTDGLNGQPRDETLTLILLNPEAKGASATITVKDTSRETCTVEGPPDPVDEGDTITFTVKTTGIEDGTELRYVLGGNGVDKDDIAGGGMEGPIEINNGEGAFTCAIHEDLTTEGPETLVAEVTVTPYLKVVSNPVNINDTSKDPTCTVTANPKTANEGDTVLFTVITSGIQPGPLPYTLSGNFIDQYDVQGGKLSGTVQIMPVGLPGGAGRGTFSIVIAKDETNEGALPETMEVAVTASPRVTAKCNLAINDTSRNPPPPIKPEDLYPFGACGSPIAQYVKWKGAFDPVMYPIWDAYGKKWPVTGHTYYITTQNGSYLTVQERLALASRLQQSAGNIASDVKAFAQLKQIPPEISMSYLTAYMYISAAMYFIDFQPSLVEWVSYQHKYYGKFVRTSGSVVYDAINKMDTIGLDSTMKPLLNQQSSSWPIGDGDPGTMGESWPTAVLVHQMVHLVNDNNQLGVTPEEVETLANFVELCFLQGQRVGLFSSVGGKAGLYFYNNSYALFTHGAWVDFDLYQMWIAAERLNPMTKTANHPLPDPARILDILQNCLPPQNMCNYWGL